MQKFNEKIWALISKVPRGKVTTYKELALATGIAGAARAVGNACNKNPNAPKTPCHRVVASDGGIGGYAHGAKEKIRLLAKEEVKVETGHIVDFEKRLCKFK